MNNERHDDVEILITALSTIIVRCMLNVIREHKASRS